MLETTDNTQNNIIDFWAKTSTDNQWHSLFHHSLDVASCMKVLLEQEWIKNIIRYHYGEDYDSADSLIEILPYLVALHDSGKMISNFQIKNQNICQIIENNNKEYSDYIKNTDYTESEHTRFSEYFLKNIFSNLDEKLVGLIAHHHGTIRGKAIKRSQMFQHEKTSKQYSNDFFNRISLEMGIEISNDKMVNYKIPDDLTWFLSGLTVISDWLGSNTKYFP